MKVFKLFLALLVVFFSFNIAEAKNNYDFFRDTAGVIKQSSFEGEKQVIANAINKFLDPAGIKIGNLNLATADGGNKIASGSVSFFGFDNIELKSELLSGPKIKSISATFPSAASITPDKLVKFLSGKTLNSFLPKSFPINTGISIKDFLLEFDDKGDSLSKFNLNFGIGSYVIEDFDGFAIDGVSIGFTLDKPTSPDHKATATVSGDGRIGAIPINLGANMSSDPDDLLFSFTATGINISSLLNAFMSEGKANSLLRFIPESFKSKQLSSITASFNPTSKNFSALAQSSFGEAELQFNAATAESKSTMLFAVAPPSGFKFSQIANTLAPLDGIDLSGTALIISTLADPDAKSSLTALKDEGEIKIEEGVNIFSRIKFNDDLAKMLKVNQLKLRGTVNETFTNMSMAASLDLNIPMGDNITMKEVVFGTRIGTVNPIVFSIAGKIEAKIGADLVGFNANFEFSPTDQQLSGEFFLNALKKENAALVTAASKEELPEWTNPFGIPGVGLRRLGVSAGIDFKNPILISSLGFTAAARVGTVPDRNKHIDGDATIVINVTNPSKSLIDVAMRNMTILAMIEAFVDNANIQGQLRTMLNSGIDNGKVLIVPVDGMQAFGKTYNKGVAVSGQLSFAGIKGYADFTMNENGVKGFGALDPIDWGNGTFQLKGRNTDKPQFSFDMKKGASPSVFIDGKISLLGVSSETTMTLADTGFAFTTSGKIADLFEATLEGRGKSFTQSGGGIAVRAVLRNDLIAKLNQLVTGKIDESIKSTKATFQSTRDKLVKAKADLKEIDDRIVKRTAAVTTRRNADLQNMRNEAERALNESKRVIEWHQANNNASYQRIAQLTNWYDWFEKQGLYTAIGLNNAAIALEQVAYDSYAKTVNGLADVGKEFPVDVELLDLQAEKKLKEAALATANLGVDVAEGVSVTTLQATKFVMDNALGGLFDIKSAEFAGTFGLNSEYKAKVAFNVTLAKNPYNFTADVDFKDLAGSAATIAKNVLSGNFMKPGFSYSFASELKKPISSFAFASPEKTLDRNAPVVNKPKVFYSYNVTLETDAGTDAGSAEKFAVILTGNQGVSEQLVLTKTGYNLVPGQKTTYSVQTEKVLGTLNKAQIVPLNPSMSDNLRLKSLGVQSVADGYVKYADCAGCIISDGQSLKTISFDGQKYADYWVVISTNFSQNSGSLSNKVTLQFVSADGRKSQVYYMSGYLPASSFSPGAVTSIPMSIPDIGEINQVIVSGGNLLDNWNFGGVIVKDDKGTVKAGYCNCSISNAITMNLQPGNYYKDYKIIIRTDNLQYGTFETDRSGTDSKEFITIIGDAGRTQRIDLGNIMTTQPGVFGIENLFEAGSTNFGWVTVKDIGNIQAITLEHEPLTAFEDKWDIADLQIISYSNGMMMTSSLQGQKITMSKTNSRLTIPLTVFSEKVNTSNPGSNTPATNNTNTTPVTNTTNTTSDLSNKTVRFQNYWKQDQRINEESGQIASSVVAETALSAQWILKPVPGTNYYWIENKDKAGHRINVESGVLASSAMGDGAWSAHWILKKNSNGTYWIENRWKTGQRLNIEKGKLESSIVGDVAWSAMWNLNTTSTTPAVTSNTTTPVANTTNMTSDLSNKTVRFQNYWKQDQRINEESGQIASSAVAETALSAQWILKPVPGTNYYWIENKDKTGHRINVETGVLASSAMGDGAWSAHWILKKNSNGTYWIENRWKTGQRLNIEKGKLECSIVGDVAWSAMWNLNTTSTTPAVTSNTTTPVANTTNMTSDLSNKTVRFQNYWKQDQRINEESGQITSSAVAETALNAQWILKPVPGTNYYWIENKDKAGHRINVETGVLASSAMGDGAWSAHWILKKNSNGTYWIENRWKTGQRLNIEKGKLECSIVGDGAWSAMWKLSGAMD